MLAILEPREPRTLEGCLLARPALLPPPQAGEVPNSGADSPPSAERPPLSPVDGLASGPPFLCLLLDLLTSPDKSDKSLSLQALSCVRRGCPVLAPPHSLPDLLPPLLRRKSPRGALRPAEHLPPRLPLAPLGEPPVRDGHRRERRRWLLVYPVPPADLLGHVRDAVKGVLLAEGGRGGAAGKAAANASAGGAAGTGCAEAEDGKRGQVAAGDVMTQLSSAWSTSTPSCWLWAREHYY